MWFTVSNAQDLEGVPLSDGLADLRTILTITHVAPRYGI